MQKTVHIEISETQLASLNDAKSRLELAKAYEIDSSELMQAASNDLKACKKEYKRLDSLRKEKTKPLDDEKTAIMNKFNPALKFLKDAEDCLKNKIQKYLDAQELLRLQREADLREQHEKEQKELLKQSAQAAKKGNTDLAAKLEQQADLPPPIVSNVSSIPQGISARKTYECDVFDEDEFFKGLYEKTIPRDAVVKNQGFLNKQANAMRNQFNYPGCKAVIKTTIATRTA